MTKKEIALIISVAVIALIGGQLAKRYFNPEFPAPMVTTVPHFEFPDTTGETRHNHEWQDSILIINFWATWCDSCREEIPEFIKLQNEYKTKKVQFVGISVDDNSAVVTEYLKSLNINYPILIGSDRAMRLARYLGDSEQAIPFTLIVNAQGTIIYSSSGILSRELFNKIVVPLL
jgi:thiol-disulfide isomerase/thioredoxin